MRIHDLNFELKYFTNRCPLYAVLEGTPLAVTEITAGDDGAVELVCSPNDAAISKAELLEFLGGFPLTRGVFATVEGMRFEIGAAAIGDAAAILCLRPW